SDVEKAGGGFAVLFLEENRAGGGFIFELVAAELDGVLCLDCLFLESRSGVFCLFAILGGGAGNDAQMQHIARMRVMLNSLESFRLLRASGLQTNGEQGDGEQCGVKTPHSIRCCKPELNERLAGDP